MGLQNEENNNYNHKYDKQQTTTTLATILPVRLLVYSFFWPFFHDVDLEEHNTHKHTNTQTSKNTNTQTSKNPILSSKVT